MERVYNFSAGPSMLPLEVLEKAQAELLCYGESGMSVMEMSHRSKDFMKILEDAEAALLKEPIPFVYVKRCGTYYMEIESLQGITKRLNNLLEDLHKAKIRREGVLETLENKKSVLEAELAKKGESYAAEISKLALEQPSAIFIAS